MITAQLLGQFAVAYDGIPLQLPTRAAQSLLAFLILTPGVKHRREKLSGTFWPDATEQNARGNLRHALWRVTDMLEKAGAPKNTIIADKLDISFNPILPREVDVEIIEQVSQNKNATFDEVLSAAKCYRGELLPGFDVEWIEKFRTRAVNNFDKLMQRLLDHLHEETHWEEMIALSGHWIAFGEDVEPAYRNLMVARYALGDTASIHAAFDECERKLLDLVDAPPSRDTLDLYSQLIDGSYPLPEKAKRKRETLTTPSNLPTFTSELVGRETVLEQIDALIVRNDVRLVNLLGPGGIGKTRLSISAAERILHRDDRAFSDGVFFVPLENARTQEEIVVAITDAARLSSIGQEKPKTQLLNYLREKKMFLVMDNFEQLLGDTRNTELIDEILMTANGVKILATSRERLHLPYEHLVEIDGLDFPMRDDDDLESYGAVQMFERAATRVYPRFDLEKERGGVARIARLTQGMPLALELAAAWVRAMSCEEIAARIKESFDTLLAEQPEMPKRHSSIRVVLNSTWNLLSDEERLTFAALSVFRSGFTFGAAKEVAKASPAMLFALSDKSIVRRAPDGRYDMHDLVRRFGEEKLDAVEDADWRETTVHARMARFFLKLAQEHPKDFTVLEPEWGNFLGALRAANERYEWGIVIDLANALLEPWSTRARFTDAREGLALACAAANADDDLGALANFMLFQGRAHLIQDDTAEAERLLNESAKLFDYQNNARGLAKAQFELSRLVTYQNKFEEALRLLDKIELAMRDSDDDDDHLLAKAFYQRAFIVDDLGKTENAILHAQKALQLFGDSMDEFASRSIVLLIRLHTEVKNYDEAQRYGVQIMASTERLADTNIAAFAYYAMCALHLSVAGVGELDQKSRDHLHESRRHGEHAQKLLIQAGERQGQAFSLRRLSHISHRLGEIDGAITQMEKSLRILREIGDQHNVALCLSEVGEYYLERNDVESARKAWSEGLTLAERIDASFLGNLQAQLKQLELV
jgi:predicted ATPase/DNA-binding SARP family transcriptional activator